MSPVPFLFVVSRTPVARGIKENRLSGAHSVLNHRTSKCQPPTADMNTSGCCQRKPPQHRGAGRGCPEEHEGESSSRAFQVQTAGECAVQVTERLMSLQLIRPPAARPPVPRGPDTIRPSKATETPPASSQPHSLVQTFKQASFKAKLLRNSSESKYSFVLGFQTGIPPLDEKREKSTLR